MRKARSAAAVLAANPNVPIIRSGATETPGTPQVVFDELHRIFKFTVDGAATAKDALLPRYFDDALTASWAGERVYINPPDGRCAEWLGKAIYETEIRMPPCDLVVALVPWNTDTRGAIDMHATRKMLLDPRVIALIANGDPSLACIAVFEK